MLRLGPPRLRHYDECDGRAEIAPRAQAQCEVARIPARLHQLVDGRPTLTAPARAGFAILRGRLHAQADRG
jgi:hypothetical protein